LLWTHALAGAPATFSGVMSVDVDLTDTRRRIATVHERIPVRRENMVLLYPQWEAASHAPSTSAHRLTRLRILAGNVTLARQRDRHGATTD